MAKSFEEEQRLINAEAERRGLSPDVIRRIEKERREIGHWNVTIALGVVAATAFPVPAAIIGAGFFGRWLWKDSEWLGWREYFSDRAERRKAQDGLAAIGFDPESFLRGPRDDGR